MTELCPDALLLNYANPMAMNCAYLERLGVRTVGLCHSVQGTTRMLADTLGVPYDEVNYRAAGVNHQAWILEFRRGDEDLYPRLREVMVRVHRSGASDGLLEPDRGDHSEVRGRSAYEGVRSGCVPRSWRRSAFSTRNRVITPPSTCLTFAKTGNAPRRSSRSGGTTSRSVRSTTRRGCQTY